MRAWEAFRIYRDMGAQRAGAAVAKQVNKSAALIDRWSAKYQWVARARSFDLHEDRMARRERRKSVIKAADRHAKIAMGMQEKVVNRLKQLNPDDMSVGECIRMFNTAVKVENDARKILPRDITPEDDYEAEEAAENVIPLPLPGADAEDVEDDEDVEDPEPVF